MDSFCRRLETCARVDGLDLDLFGIDGEEFVERFDVDGVISLRC